MFCELYNLSECSIYMILIINNQIFHIEPGILTKSQKLSNFFTWQKKGQGGALQCVQSYSYSSWGGWWTGSIFFSDFGNFFQHVTKLLNFGDFVNIKVTPANLDHLGFYCKYSLFLQDIQKSQKLKSKLSTNRWDPL